MYDIDVELVVDPDSVSDLWSLVTLHSGSELLARGVSLTISNPSLMPATLISVPQNDLVGLDALMPDRMMARNSLVVLSESFCRGQMDFVLQKRLSSVDYRLDNVAMAINYGLNRARFMAPVPVGSRVRATGEIADVQEKGPAYEVVVKLTYEVEGGDKPPCVAEVVVVLQPA